MYSSASVVCSCPTRVLTEKQLKSNVRGRSEPSRPRVLRLAALPVDTDREQVVWNLFSDFCHFRGASLLLSVKRKAQLQQKCCIWCENLCRINRSRKENHWSPVLFFFFPETLLKEVSHFFRLQIVTKNGHKVKSVFFQPCASGMCAACKARCPPAWLQFGSGASRWVSFIVIGLAQEQPGHWASSLILCQTGTSDRAGKLCWQPKTNDLLATSLALFEDSCWCLACYHTAHFSACDSINTLISP